MNKQTIITILLALVAVAGQAQVKSSLDLCLRDEATGEWLIGLFDDYAIYDCEYWNYAEVGKDHVVLTKDGQRKEVRLIEEECRYYRREKAQDICANHTVPARLSVQG